MTPAVSWSEFLTKAELRELTGKRGQAQVAVLIEECIPHRVLRGQLKVSRFHVREWLCGRVPVKVGVGPRLDLVK